MDLLMPMFLFFGAILTLIFAVFSLGNTPSGKGCKKSRRHKWEFIDQERKCSGYICWTNWTKWKCKKCGKIQKYDPYYGKEIN
jgi:hypothetical protein